MLQPFEHATMAGRPTLRWPDGRRLAVWVVPNVEHYEFMPSAVGARNPWPRSAWPDALDYPRKEYGNRVGLERFLEITDRLSIPCTVSLSLAVPEMFPELFEEMRRRDWEFMCHGLYNTHYLWNYPEEDERAFIAECQRRMLEATGKPLRGWFSPACSHTLNTIELVAEAGIDYLCDLFHDDQPFPLQTRTGDLITIPYTMEVNDAVIHVSGGDNEAFAHAMLDQFEVLYEESATSGRVMCIALHPYIIAQPHRVASFERALAHIAGHDDVWMTTGIEIATWWRTHHQQEVTEWLQTRR